MFRFGSGKKIPRNEKTEPMSPMKNDRPWELHPPWFKNKVNTSLADPFDGDIYTKGIKTAKNPKICKIKINPSIFGSTLLTTVFTKTATTKTAQKIKVACHAWKLYDGWFNIINAWISVAQRNAPDATRACQPATVSHPNMRRVRSSCYPVGSNAARTCNVAKKIPTRGRSEHCDPVVLTAGSRCPCRRSFISLKENAIEAA